MKFKHFLIAIFAALLIFMILVFLGMKFEWVKSIKEDEPNTLNLPPEQAVLLENTEKEERQPLKMPEMEILNETSNSTMDMIRNDCIRASRHAGVGDADIHRVVNECVAMEVRRQGHQPSVPGPDGVQTGDAVENSDESYQLTREACEMVARETPNLSPGAREQQIQQCITDNLDN